MTLACEKCGKTLTYPGPPLGASVADEETYFNDLLDNGLSLDEGTSLVEHRTECGGLLRV